MFGCTSSPLVTSQTLEAGEEEAELVTHHPLHVVSHDSAVRVKASSRVTAGELLKSYILMCCDLM